MSKERKVPKKILHRSAITGLFVTPEYAEANKNTTVVEEVTKIKTLLEDYGRFVRRFPELTHTELVDKYLE